MKIATTTVLVDLGGHPIMDGETAVTVGTVLVHALLSPAPPGRMYLPEEHKRRLDLARAANSGPTVEVPDEDMPGLIADVARLSAPLVGGQVIPLLEGEHEA
ncbi:MAG: hypothetical protein ACOY4R_27600 [Pseudomonadota bacterium]